MSCGVLADEAATGIGMMTKEQQRTSSGQRRRLSRDDRRRQLVDVAWRLIRDEGTEALTLGRLAEHAGVTKPVVYDHFGDRTGLLTTLYREFDERQTVLMDAALRTSEPTLTGTASVIASAYIECVLVQGREIPGVIAALAGSPALAQVKHEGEAAFLDRCTSALAPFTGGGAPTQASLRAMLGAAEALAEAAAVEEITARQAEQELVDTIVAMVERTASHADDG